MNAITEDKIDQVDYTWELGDGTTGHGSKVSPVYTIPDTSYDIKIFADSKTTGCKDTLFKPKFIRVFPEPTAGFDFDPKVLNNENSVASFFNQSQGSDHYLWQFDDGYTTHQENPTHNFKVVGPRRVLLEAGNEFGCSDTISNEILIALNRIFPPNAFSPNAPEAKDREYKLGSDGIAVEGYHLVIMSRWNDIVFEARNEIKGWNGQMHDSSFAPAGAYVWILDFTDFLGRRHRQTGTVTLVY
jgi:hypothetical protein